MDVGKWLRSIGLGQYEAAFRDNEIDDDGNITDEVWMEYIKAKHRQSQMIISR
jgi:hypothetical protein